jgi:hypothetical protein
MNDENAPGRRTVLRSAAWAIPVVAVAVATPAAAASEEKLTWTWTAEYVTSRQVDTYFTATNPTDSPVDVVFQAPRSQGAVEFFGYGFGPWVISLGATTVTCTTTIPARSSVTTQWLGYWTRTPPVSEVLLGTLRPAGAPAVPSLSLSFT